MKNQSLHNSEDAGEAIAAGGFGCVFRPPIKCNIPDGSPLDKKKYLKLLQDNPYITKLLIKKYAAGEMAEVNKILPIVKTIPNYKKYFLLDDIFSCDNFGPLTSEDFKNFSKCNNLIKKGYTTANINSKLNTLGTIYIPDGGKSVKDIIHSLSKTLVNTDEEGTEALGRGKEARLQFGLLSWGLVNLLQYAIIPMNEKGLVHFDLKADNMMIKPEELAPDSNIMPNIKLIDWGLSGIIASPTSDPIKEIQDRPIQFNAPFSNILFSNRLQDILIDFSEMLSNDEQLSPDLKGIIPDSSIKSLASFILFELIPNGDSGHIGWMNENLTDIFQKFNANDIMGDVSKVFDVNDTCFANNTLFYSYFIEYLTAILNKYLVRDSEEFFITDFDAKAYFQEVYRYNCDIWGLLTAYQDILLMDFDYPDILYVKISNLVMKYLYSTTYAATRIPTDELIKDLSELSNYYHSKPNSSSLKVSSNKSVSLSSDPTTLSELIPSKKSSTKKTSSKKPSSKKPSTKKVVKKRLKKKVYSGSTTLSELPIINKPAKKSAIKSTRRLSKGYSAFVSPPQRMSKGNSDLIKSPKLVAELKITRKRCPRGWKRGHVKGKGYRCIKK